MYTDETFETKRIRFMQILAPLFVVHLRFEFGKQRGVTLATITELW